MKTALQTTLATIAPLISIQTIWSYDDDADMSIFHPGNALENEDPQNWYSWMAEIKAATIHTGEIITASAYLGGIWEKAESIPAEANPEISGYERDLTVGALEQLKEQLPASHVASYQITAARAALSE
jgi:hypothetical protein